MQIVVNHLTRMQQGYMCVAGIDLETHLHVRPVIDCQMPIDLLSVHGGPFDMARIVDLGPSQFAGKVPEVEDRFFDGTLARHVGDMPAEEFWALLQTVAHEKLGTIFGPDLERVGSTCAVVETGGLRSLGCYWAPGGRLHIDDSYERPRIRFAWQSGDHTFNVPVTDVRLYESDHITPFLATVRWLAEQIAIQPRVLVSVGLSRPYRKSAGEPSRHWLQINNFHLAEKACWKLLAE
jgi:hypothetical protein